MTGFPSAMTDNKRRLQARHVDLHERLMSVIPKREPPVPDFVHFLSDELTLPSSPGLIIETFQTVA